MFKLNLIVAYRNLLRNKFYATINIVGLALGLTTSMLIATYVIDENSYDKHWQGSEAIFRMAGDLKFEDNEFNMATTPAPMANMLRSEFPEIEAVGRLRTVGSELVKIGDNYFEQTDISYFDSQTLDVFKLNYLEGNPTGLLSNPDEAIISRSTSEKLFGSLNSIDKSFEAYGNRYAVKAVYEDMPGNSHFDFHMILSMVSLEEAKNPIWFSNNFVTYLKLKDPSNYLDLEQKLPEALDKHVSPQLQQIMGIDLDTFLASGGRFTYYLQKLEDIHLHSNLMFEIRANGDLQFVYIFIAAGIFVLLIAIINFMNISTARSSLRAKEVGLRKVMGSKRNLLIGQFITESMLSTLFATAFGIALLYVILPFFNELTLKGIADPIFGRIGLWDEILIAFIAVGLLSGIYPAIYLSGFIPIKVLKGELALGMKSSGLRNALVIVQFSASIILIFGAVVIYSQLNYTMNKNLGYEKENVMLISEAFHLGTKMNSFKEELLNSPMIQHVSISSFFPTSGNRSDSPLMPEGMTNTEGAVSLQTWAVDEDYIPTLQLNILKGRNFDKNLASDSSGIIINALAAKRLGFEDPIGQKLKTIEGFPIYGKEKYTIIGVIDDFHIDNFKNAKQPMALFLTPSSGYISLRFTTEYVGDVIALTKDLWNEFNPNLPFNYIFLDEQFSSQFQTEQRLGTLFNSFAILAILIACLGLFGLAAFTADQRKKELGIRKVLGASVQNLMTLQLSSYTKMLVISIVISLPIAYYITSLWLDDFIYRTDFNIFMFVFPALLVLVMAWMTVSFISYSATRKNPVDNLKYE